MSKKILTPFLLAIVLFSSNVFASPVPVDNARAVALNFYKLSNTAQNGTTPFAVLNYSKTEADGTVDFYVFDVYPMHSFVIVSGDDNAKPVIGYSTETYFNSTLTGVTTWMNSASLKIKNTVSKQIMADENIKMLWSSYAKGVLPVSTRGTTVGPLCKTTWNQEPNYNALCPYNSTDQQRCVTGCVATAMAQIMKYWNYPATGKGSYSYHAYSMTGHDYGTLSANFGTTTYNWANMPNNLNGANSDVATLNFQCGVSVAMEYGDDNEDGSGSYVLASEVGPGGACAQYSYKTYFSYNPNTLKGVQYDDYTPTTWVALMKNEINIGRPVQYEGFDDNGNGGHTWVMDGYDATGLLHMNWGWGGQDNGFYDVTNLNAYPYSFNTSDAALIGIQPLAYVNVVATAVKPDICHGDSTMVSASGPKGAKYTWTPTTGLSCSNCASTLAKPAVTTTYIVTADSSGVKGSNTVIVNVSSTVTPSFNPNVSTACSAPAPVTFINTSANATSYFWNFGDGTTGTDVSPTHNYATNGTFNVTLQATGPCGVSTITKNNVVHINDISPVVNSENICSGQNITLNASSSAGTLSWFAASTGYPSIGGGTAYTTPTLTSTTTYYVESDIVAPVLSSNPSTYNFGTGSFFLNTYTEHSVIFNCLVPQTLKSVDVYASGAGDRIINLRDSSGTIVESKTVNIPNGVSTVSLDFPLTMGNNMKLCIVGNVSLYRNKTGASYPYYSSDSTVILTNSDAGTPGYYYYFYNWKLQGANCSSGRIPVKVNVYGSGDSFTSNAVGSNVNFTPTNTNAGTYTWHFGDGTTSSDMNTSHNYSKSGKYTVKLVETNGSCYDSVSRVVNIIATGTNDIAASLGSILLMPNPVTNNLQVQVNATDNDNYTLSIHNILGETLLTKNVFLTNGDNRVNIDVASFASGVYFMRLTGVDGITQTRKFVKD